MQRINAARSTLVLPAVILLLACLFAHLAAQPGTGRAALPVGGPPTATPACGPPALSPWQPAQPLPTAVRLPAVASDGRYAYAAGGLGGGSDQFVRYDPPTDTWQTLPPLPTPVTGATLLFAPSTGKLYLFGGSSGSTVGTSTQIYDPATARWSAGAVLPAPRSVMSGGVWQGKLYLAAGADTLRFTPQVQLWAYDPLTDSWDTTLPALPGATMGAVGAVVGGHLLIAGGADSNANPLSSLYDYDLTTRHWRSRAALPQAVYGAGGALPGAELWVVGGGTPFVAGAGPARWTDRPQGVLGTTQLYDPAQDSWRSGPALTSPRALLGGTAIGTVVLAVGGFVDSTDQATVERTDAPPGIPCPTATPTPTVTGTPPTATATPSPTATLCGNWGSIDPWAISSTLPPPLAGAAVTTDGSALYSAGGETFAHERGIAQVARYDPPTDTWTLRASLPISSSYAALVYAPNVQRFYYFGGIAYSYAYGYTQVYNPTPNTWQAGVDMPDWRAFVSGIYTAGRIYVVGGSSSAGFAPHDNLWVYDPLAGTWDTSLPPIPVSTMGAASGVIQGQLYVAGGATQAQQAQGGLYDYDIAARTWYTRTPMLQPVYEPAGVVLGGRLWVIGGASLNGVQRADTPAGVTTVQIYDPLTDSWSWGPSLTGGRSHSGATVIGNQVLVFGGGDATFSDTLEMTTFHPGLACPSATATATLPPTGTPTDTATPSATITATGSATPTRSTTATPLPTTTGLPHTGTPTLTAAPPSATAVPPTRPPSATATPCAIQFSDVTDPRAYYYAGVYYLACRGVVSGYADGTFQPFALTTRGQMTKIVTLAFGLAAATPPTGGTFADVVPANRFYGLI